jgi:hypothetical protein
LVNPPDFNIGDGEFAARALKQDFRAAPDNRSMRVSGREKWPDSITRVWRLPNEQLF